MAATLITYDLNKETVRPNIVGAIQKFDGWAKLSESSYAVTSNLTPSQIHEKLKPFLDSNDQIYVITLSQPYSGYGPKNVNDWLDNNL